MDCVEHIERHRGAWVVGTELAWARCQGGARLWSGCDPWPALPLLSASGRLAVEREREEDEQGRAIMRGPLAATAGEEKGARG